MSGATPLITLFTDISHDHQTGIGAYAWWAMVNGATFRGANVFRDRVTDNNVAEVWGLINGVFASIQAINPPAGAKYIAQTDSGVPIAILEGRSGADKTMNVGLRALMDDKLAKHGLLIEYRHVPAHKGDTRNLMNSWCDREARRLMKQRRTALHATL
jgi:ribonuclease HI